MKHLKSNILINRYTGFKVAYSGISLRNLINLSEHVLEKLCTHTEIHTFGQFFRTSY